MPGIDIRHERYYKGLCAACGKEPLQQDKHPLSVLGKKCMSSRLIAPLNSNLRIIMGLRDDE